MHSFRITQTRITPVAQTETQRNPVTGITSSICKPVKLNDSAIMKRIYETHNARKYINQFHKREQEIEAARQNQSTVNKFQQLSKPKSETQLKRPAKVQYYNKINEENLNLAHRIMNLPPVINNRKQFLDYQVIFSNYTKKHVTDLNLMQKYHASRPLDSFDVVYRNLNEYSGGKFSNSKNNSLAFLSQINQNRRYLFIDIVELKLFGIKHTSFLQKNPSSYQWIVLDPDQKILRRTAAWEWDRFIKEMIEFGSYNCNVYINLWKIKGNLDFELGGFIYNETQSPFNNIELRDGLHLRVSNIIKSDIRKQIGDESVLVGSIEFKVYHILKETISLPGNDYQINIV